MRNKRKNSNITGVTRVVRWLAIKFIRVYQLTLSPYVGQQCRFYPTCSHYAQEAIEVHGIGKGSWLTLKRLGRCQPFFSGGVDPVPESNQVTNLPQKEF